jgi:CRISPR system Cascade subunit CasD
MSNADNTLFLRLAGPMQSWGTKSRMQLRRTDGHPSKSGVLGLLLCAKGVRREDSEEELKALNGLMMGVRVDREGIKDSDYHSTGAKIGIRKAEGGIKHTATTNELETQLSQREYLYDASFLVALKGDLDMIGTYAAAIRNPIWPVFLGRKCCIPGEPIFEATGEFETLGEALSSVPWRPRINAVDRTDRSQTRTLDVFIEHPHGSPPPGGAQLVSDVPRVFGFYGHGARWVAAGNVTIPVGPAIHPPPRHSYFRRPDYSSPQWKAARKHRLETDNYLCVFCKSPAVEVHHVDYTNVGYETDADLRSLCELCHDACTNLEYSQDMQKRRIDPLDPELRKEILAQTRCILDERRSGRRRELLQEARKFAEGLSR